MASDGTPGDGDFGPRGAAYNSCSVSLRGSGSSRTPGRTRALAVFGLLGAEWCNASARAIATVCRSCLTHERSSRRLLAAPSRSYSMAQPLETTAKERLRTLVLPTLTVSALVVVVVRVVVVLTVCIRSLSITLNICT